MVEQHLVEQRIASRVVSSRASARLKLRTEYYRSFCFFSYNRLVNSVIPKAIN